MGKLIRDIKTTNLSKILSYKEFAFQELLPLKMDLKHF